MKYFFKKGIDKAIFLCYNIQVRGGIAQLARATGSYPVGHGFKSNSRYHGPLVKRLRHRPFTAVTGVRFSHGSPIRKAHCKSSALFLLLTRRLHETRQCKYSLHCRSSHTPPEDRRARSSGAGCGYIRATREILPQIKAFFSFERSKPSPTGDTRLTFSKKYGIMYSPMNRNLTEMQI